MGAAQGRPALAGFRDTVRELTKQGLPLGDVEDAIEAQRALSEDQRAALWVFAFSLRDRSEKQRLGRTLLDVAGAVPEPDRARPREFDARGFPIPQRNRSFLERVARLLSPE
jgi:hypothetical protein